MAKRKQDNSKLVAAASYFVLVFPVIGIAIAFVVYLFGTDSYVKYHALQSTLYGIVASVVLVVLNALPVVGGILVPIATFLAFVLWLYLMYEALQGRKYQLPYAGPIAQRNS